MPHLTWLLIAASGLLFGQMQNFGNAPDPEEKKRGEKMVSQGDTMVAQIAEQTKLNRKQVRIGEMAIGIAIIALIVSFVALFRSH